MPGDLFSSHDERLVPVSQLPTWRTVRRRRDHDMRVSAASVLLVRWIARRVATVRLRVQL